MADKPKPQRMERFTMLEPMGPNNPSPEELATRVVDLAFDKERFTMLEPMGPNNPSPEELATRVVDLATGDRAVAPASAELPHAVLSLFTELAAAVAALDARTRAAALKYISAELPKRTAG